MNKIKLFSLSLVALFMACFTACESKYDVDHTAHIVGTWTCLRPGYAEALVIKADGSVLSTGCDGEDYWENVAGTIKIKDNVATMTFEDGDDAIGHIDVVPGIAFSIYEEDGEEWTFNYCAEDLSEEVVGMWVCHEGLPGVENDMAVVSYSENGKMTMTTQASAFIPADLVNVVSSYVVVGDLLFMNVEEDGIYKYAARLAYTPNGTTLGDIFTQTLYTPTENGIVKVTSTFLRVKESLNFTGQTYDYVSAYVTNAKGKDEDFTILGHTFNIANITGGNFDMLFRSELFYVDLNANSIKQYYRLDNGQNIEIEIPITVDGNKVTLDMSNEHSAYRKVDIYMFQSANDSQLHMYMHTDAFINYFANMELYNLLSVGKINPDDTAAIAKVFADMEARIESINVSMVFKARK